MSESKIAAGGVVSLESSSGSNCGATMTTTTEQQPSSGSSHLSTMSKVSETLPSSTDEHSTEPSEADLDVGIVNSVIENLRDEGIDSVLLEQMKNLWLSKLVACQQETAASGDLAAPKPPNMTLTLEGACKKKKEEKKKKKKKSKSGGKVLTSAGAGGRKRTVNRCKKLKLDQSQAVSGAASSVVMRNSNLPQSSMKIDQISSQASKSTTTDIATEEDSEELVSTRTSLIPQVDGPVDSSDDDEEAGGGAAPDDDDDLDDLDDDDDDDDNDPDDEDDDEGGEEEPLGSDDDISDEDASDLFETDNVVVCQYEKITRSRNKWKFHLKDGIMNLNGRDFVFSRAQGEAEW